MAGARQIFSFRRNLLAWVLLVVALAVTAAATTYTKNDADADAQKDFEFACNEVAMTIDARMHAYAQVLRSCAALFHASKDVTREEWRVFSTEQKVEKNLPGIQGIGFSELIRPQDLDAHVQTVRAEGFPDYQVTPPGLRPIYTSIIYLEPFNERNRRAFGYDMYSDPIRRKAMDQAADNDVAALSGRVTLIQETDTDVQAGALMYVPVYRQDMKTDSVAHRRAALRGWVYSPYRMNDLMDGVLQNPSGKVRRDLRLKVYDRSDFTSESLMYDSGLKETDTKDRSSTAALDIQTTFNGHLWFLRFVRTHYHPKYRATLSVGLSGIIISLLLFGMVTSLLMTRHKARQLAEQLKVETRLEALNRELRKNESLHRMAGAIAHHFNNKLGAVMGNLDLIREDLPEHSHVRTMIEAAAQAASGAAEISGKMLTYLGQSEKRPSPDDLPRIVRAGLPLLRTVAPINIDVETNLPVAGPFVCVDRNQIQQVLTNLVTNAFEAVDTRQGRVVISVNEVAASDLPVNDRFPIDWHPDCASYASLEITDTGVGIAKENFNKLFDPFYSSRFTGRGLGLAAVLGITRAHGGAVAVESVQGVGSRFRVFLPACEKAPRADTPLPPSAVPEEESRPTEEWGWVLVVEDETSLRKTSETMLSRLGCRVLSAENGEEAIHIFRQHAFEIRVVLCDLSMPRVDGRQTLKALRQIRADIPVILTSGHVESHAMAGMHEEQPQVFLHKPYRKDDLKDALERAVRAL